MVPGRRPAEEAKVENEPRTVAPAPKPAPGPKVEPTVTPKIVETLKVDVALPEAKLGTDLAGAYMSLTDVLAGVKDAPTADAALPELTDWTTKLDGYKAIWDKLNYTGKASVTKVTTDHLGKLKDLVANVLKIGGLSDQFKEVVNGLIARLAALAVS